MATAQEASAPSFRLPDEPPATTGKQNLSIEARIRRGEAPLSRIYGGIALDSAAIYRLPPLAKREMQQDGSLKRLKIGAVRILPETLDPQTSGRIYAVPGGRVNLIGIQTAAALQVRVQFTNVNLPKGAKLFVYSMRNRDEIYGSFEGRGPLGNGEFWTPPVEGDGIIVEYYRPGYESGGETKTAPPFQIARITHIFKDASGDETPSTEAAGSCNLSVPAEWTNIAKSVGRLSFVSGGGSYVCTGTLLNTQANNGSSKYLLTANHCISTQAEAQSLRVRWFYDSPSAATSYTDGSTLLSTGTQSDYTLLQLTGTLPGGLILAGWTTTMPAVSAAVTGIHHPAGDYKRIAYGSRRGGACPSGLSCLPVGWNNGTTEGGSSGSGLWVGSASNAPQLVGTLNGGEASCDNLSGTDYYGRFDATYPNIASYLTGGTAPAAPPNNDFANAQNISGSSGSASGANIGANKEAGEPNHAGNSGGASVWYRWQAPATGTVTFTTANSDFDTLLAFYNGGGSVSSLTALASNDDSIGQQSSITVGVSAGATYNIAVDGYAGSTGNITLNWSLSIPAPANPIDTVDFFVSQQYRDFLSREADTAGLAFWKQTMDGRMNACGAADNAEANTCRARAKASVSEAFFVSVEFQQTGYLVYRLYKTSYPASPARPRGLLRYAEFLRDAQAVGSGVVVGQTGWEAKLEANKQALIREFVQRTEFIQRFPETMSGEQYVQALLTTANLPTTGAEQQAALTAYGSGGVDGRARAVRSIAESDLLFRQEFNQAFVLMQYFGYLRRNADEGEDANRPFAGYDFWLAKLISESGDTTRFSTIDQLLEPTKRARMVEAFVVTGEYRRRFGRE